jgi:CubicO group peptidase (beta-lactamase class C family)
LEDLLNHLGGVLAFNDTADIDTFLAYLAAQTGPLPTTFAGRERFFAQWLLAQQPPEGVVPGKTFYYSNAGYVLAAMMLKQATGQDFPTLFEQYVSQPLNGWIWLGSRNPRSQVMTTGYQGPPGELAPPSAIPADLEPWNEVLNQPAGDVYSTSLGYSLWLQTLAAALRGESNAVPAAYVAKLTAAATGDYVLGWESGSLDGRDAFAHTGIVDGYTCIAVVDRSGGVAACALSNTESPDGGADWVTPAMFDPLVSVDTAW